MKSYRKLCVCLCVSSHSEFMRCVPSGCMTMYTCTVQRVEPALKAKRQSFLLVNEVMLWFLWMALARNANATNQNAPLGRQTAEKILFFKSKRVKAHIWLGGEKGRTRQCKRFFFSSSFRLFIFSPPQHKSANHYIFHMFVQFLPSDACFHVTFCNKNTYYERCEERQQQPNGAKIKQNRKKTTEKMKNKLKLVHE